MGQNKGPLERNNISEVEIINAFYPNEPDTLFICCSSFEDRCRKVPLQLFKDNYRCVYSAMFNYFQGVKQNRRFFNREKIYEALTSVTINNPVKPIDCDRLSSLDGENKLNNFIIENDIRNFDNPRITIDISTFTKQYILQLLYYFDYLFQARCSIRLLYTEPGVYGRGLFKRLTYGIEDTIIIPRFEGKQTPNAKTALIVFLGYESHRTLAAIEKCEPDLAIAVIGNPPYYPEWDNYSIKAHSYILSMPNVNTYEMSTRDPVQIKEKLSEIWDKIYLNYPNIIISPTGTKLQTIGIYEFTRSHSTVRIIYPIPKSYLESYYTTGYGKTLEYFLPKI